MATAGEELGALVARYRQDPESVYNTWFIRSPERLKAFRSIRRGVTEVVRAIREGAFGDDFKGSPLETVLASITEQKQVFDGAAHPFYWKPKLRIPDIYESEPNQRAFGQFLERASAPPTRTGWCAASRSSTGCASRGSAPRSPTYYTSCTRPSSRPSTRRSCAG
jgi:type II restriction enzyme